jgi:peptidoglycan hydrolase FlgJ
VTTDGISTIGAMQVQAQLAMAEAGRANALVAKAARAVTASKEVPGTANEKDAKLLQACKDFESIFLAYLLKTMRETVPKGELLGDSKASEIFSSMRDDSLAKDLSQTGGIGISRLLYDQMRKTL